MKGDNNSKLGSKMLDDSYSDGRVFCWSELPMFLRGKKFQLKISNDGKIVYLLFPLDLLSSEKMLGKESNKNDIHFMLLNQAWKEALDKNEVEMKKVSENIGDRGVSPGWTAEALFHLDYPVHRYFVDDDGLRCKKIYISPKSMRFWLQKSDTTGTLH